MLLRSKTLLHDTFKSFEVNGVHFALGAITPSFATIDYSLPSCFSLGLFIDFFFLLLLLLILFKNVIKHLDVVAEPDSCTLKVFYQSLNRDHITLGNRIKGKSKVHARQLCVVVCSSGYKLCVVDRSCVVLVNALESLLQIF